MASEKLFTELTTLAALTPIAASCDVDGLDGSALTALESASTDDVIALVSLGKSLLAESTSVVASLWIVVSCVLQAADPAARGGAPQALHGVLRSVRSEQ